MPALILLSVLLMALAGCINIDTQLQPIDPSVKALVIGEDCSTIVLGVGFGSNTVERAMVSPLVQAHDHLESAPGPIKRIRSIALGEGTLLLFGRRCVTVTGEP